MSRALLVLSTFALFAVAVSGCLGGDDVDSGLPTARVTVTQGADEYTYVFDATGSTGTGLGYAWDFGDGTTSTEPKVEHTFDLGDAHYDVSLIVTDKDDTTAIWTRTIKVGTGINNPPEATFTLSARYLEIGEALTVDASATVDIDNDPLTYEWDFNFPSNQNDYLKFRDAKMDAEPEAQGPESDGAEAGNGTGDDIPAGAPDVPSGSDVYEAATSLVGRNKDAGHCHGPCPIDQAPSFEMIQATTNEPVYTLEAGFPEATIFYVKLTAKDAKGGFQQIVSEEIFPVKVVATKESDSIADQTSGQFTLGGPSTLTDNTPDAEGVPYDDEAAGEQAWEVVVPKPIIDGAFQVRWTAVSDEVTASNIEVHLDTESGKHWEVQEANNQTSGGITIRISEADEMGTGTWTLSLWARMGVQIDWTADYAFTLDLNPFRDLEAPYL